MVSEKSWQTAWMRSKNNPLLFVTDVLAYSQNPGRQRPLKQWGGMTASRLGPATVWGRPRTLKRGCHHVACRWTRYYCRSSIRRLRVMQL